jgi:hypothetical protein
MGARDCMHDYSFGACDGSDRFRCAWDVAQKNRLRRNTSLRRRLSIDKTQDKDGHQ